MIPKALAIAGSIVFVTPAFAGGVSGVPTFTHTGVNNFCFQIDNKAQLYGVPLVGTLAEPESVDPTMAGSIDRAAQHSTKITFEFFDSANIDCNVGGFVKKGFRVRAIDKGNLAK